MGMGEHRPFLGNVCVNIKMAKMINHRKTWS